MSPNSFSVSPQRIDPLSWFTRSFVPLSFAAITVLFGLGSIIAEWPMLASPALDLVAVGIMASACLVVQVQSRPLRPPYRAVQAILPVSIAAFALSLSAFANAESPLEPQFWWAPVGVGAVVATLGPYLSVRAVIVVGSTLSLLAGVASELAFLQPTQVWQPLSVAIVGANSVVLGTVATALFGFVVVSRTRALLSWAGSVVPESEAATDIAASHVERVTVARLGSRVSPFLARIAEDGVVTDNDRALAGQLARRLRSDLVEQANRSWLDVIATNGRIFVVDPDRRANHMNQAQRAALRGLLEATLDRPGADAGSLFLELRGQPDGGTAVALSFDVTLPEGRKGMLLAPYYLALQSTVTDVTWNSAREMLRFRVPGAKKAR